MKLEFAMERIVVDVDFEPKVEVSQKSTAICLSHEGRRA